MKKPFVHRKEKIMLYMLLIVLLLANMAAINIGVASTDEPKLYVDPPRIVDPTLTLGELFSINITIANVTDLHGFEFDLCYNTTILAGIGVIIVPFNNETNFTSNSSIKDNEGFIWVNVTYHSSAEPLTTTDPATLATIFFWVEALGSTVLDICDTKLIDDEGNPINHSVEDGYFRNLLLPPVASFTYSPLTPKAGDVVTFNASASYTPVGYHIVNYTWNFGDGNITIIGDDESITPIIIHTYTSVGTYNVTLTVADDQGLTNSTTKSITVQDDTPPTIDDPSRTPSGDIDPFEAVKISVNVTDAGSGVKNVTLSYTITNVTWLDLEMVLNATGFYEATIPGQPAYTWVRFNITAYDNAENSITRDGTAIQFVYKVIPEFPSFIILQLFMITVLVAVILGKTAWSRKRRSPFVAK